MNVPDEERTVYLSSLASLTERLRPCTTGLA